jgi:exonuclease III
MDGLVDCWIAAGNDAESGGTIPRKNGSIDRIDFAFVTADLARKVTSMEVDSEAQGSDHQPIRVELDL